MKVRLCCLLATLTGLANAADYAVVVGIQEYNKALTGASNLHGPVDDALAIAQALKLYGFSHITLLKNEAASRSEIMNAIRKVRTKIRPSERFVFYFAGHGRSLPASGVLPFDAHFDPDNDLTPKMLNDELGKMKARSKTVILDSCFSGAFYGGTKAVAQRMGVRSFPPPQGGAKGTDLYPPKSNGQDMVVFDKGSGVCYFLATSKFQPALEDQIDGVTHGLFTAALLAELGGDKKPWQAVETGVSRRMFEKLDKTGRQQTPVLSRAYRPVVVFGGPTDRTRPSPPDPTVLDVFNVNTADPDKVALKVTPDRGVFQPGEKYTLAVTVKAKGWLVVLDYDGDKLVRVFPKETNEAEINAADLASGKKLVDLGGLTFDQPATDRIKAMLFPTKDSADAMVGAVPYMTGNDSLNLEALRQRRDSLKGQGGFVTSEIEFHTGKTLIGGAGVKEDKVDGLISKLIESPDAVSALIRSVEGSDRVDLLRGAQGQSANQKLGLTLLLLNEAIQIGLGDDPAPWAKVTLRAATQALLAKKPTAPADKLALGRMLLEDAYPDELDKGQEAGK